MSRYLVILILLAFPGLALAQDPSDPAPKLQLSWSVYAQVDTLYFQDSGWTHCYLWLDPSPNRDDLVGFWGTLFQSHAVEVHRWRYMGSGAGGDIAIDPGADQHRLGYLDIPCENDSGAKVLCEFDVWIDVDQLADSEGRPSTVGLVEAGASEWDPMVFYRKDIAEPCGYRSVGFAAEPNRLIVLQSPVPVHRSTFGTLKAYYR